MGIEGGKGENIFNSTTLVEEHGEDVSPPEYILQKLTLSLR
jgi:hypothetical protein